MIILNKFILEDYTQLKKIISGSLYHYTSDNAIRNILTNGDFWVSKSNFLNDSTELRYIDEILEETCCEFMEDMATGKLLYEEIKKDKDKLVADSFVDGRVSGYYILSLTLNPDSITLWSEYSNFFGYNLGFNAKELRKILDNNKSINPMSIDCKVIYSKKEQKKIIKEELIDITESEISSSFKDTFQNFDKKVNKNFYNIISHLSVKFLLYSMFFKKEFFSHEQEYRIVFIQTDVNDKDINPRFNKKIKFRSNNGIIIPYIEIKLETDHNKLPIETITVGPKNNIDLAVTGAYYLLNYLGYNSVEVKRSEIPIRY